MKSLTEKIYAARWIFPISQPPIQAGFVRLVDGQVAEIGSLKRAKLSTGDCIDLGDVAVLPRLVNAHTHLEFSDCRTVIGDRGIPLAQWIGMVIAERGAASTQQRADAIASGLAESVAAGVGLVADIATTPSQYPADQDVQIISCAEVLGLSPPRAEERFAAAQRHAEELTSADQIQFAVSPHAPYSTPWDLVRRCVQLARKHRSPLAMHVAESADERELVRHGSGRFATALQTAGLWREGLFPWSGQQPIVDLIDLLATAPRALLVHGNDLNDAEIERIARHPNLSVVYCPRTHDFFGYPPHPVDRLVAAGIPVALGTDSRASNPDLSVWGELQFLLNHRTDLAPQQVLSMATQAGADALLGPGSGFGTLAAGSGVVSVGGSIPLVAVPTQATTLDQVWRDFADRDLRPLQQ
ncbi:amidohydrolase family protein [Stieleria sp. TO1_6]|uniref:amidohydrolase family protein n=1 Tax=Stieleria tagensis TaxID=2956795 RepID=UPI00209AC48B|nr:amidohydrolase family protein [Stieleria tagensis]MCO8122857.1 amidohydrolase family protein [Stieleria tagensis]